ncbi:MAG: DNA cytosine methyltransferase [Methylovulum miyakonense]|uniref:DNA cytosine methyltransferase n=1 Tax=Methylovulum miyakonense TaxID=645578 RepID=UPI003BB69757
MKTYYEFFAGGGMARAGLGSEWQCLLANDISEKKASSYKENWGDDDLVVGDIFNINLKDIKGHADLAWGSFPCQDLSLAGGGAGLKGTRSGAFWGFWKIIQGLNIQGRKPPIIVLENVYGALTSHGGKDFEDISKAVASEGYVVGAMVIDAVHFLPQSRPRLFIVAVDSTMSIPDSTATATATPAWHPYALIRAYNMLPSSVKKSWRWWSLPTPSSQMLTLDEIIEAKPKGVEWHSASETQKILSMMTDVNLRKVMTAQAAGRLKVGTIYKRTRLGIQRAEVRFDGIAGCLRTPSGGSSRQTIMVVDGPKIRTRLLSPREAARLMGLSDTYLLPKRYNDAYHLVGDGVAVPVVAHIAQHLLNPIISTQGTLSVPNFVKG